MEQTASPAPSEQPKVKILYIGKELTTLQLEELTALFPNHEIVRLEGEGIDYLLNPTADDSNIQKLEAVKLMAVRITQHDADVVIYTTSDNVVCSYFHPIVGAIPTNMRSIHEKDWITKRIAKIYNYQAIIDFNNVSGSNPRVKTLVSITEILTDASNTKRRVHAKFQEICFTK